MHTSCRILGRSALLLLVLVSTLTFASAQTPTPAYADVDDFAIESFDAEYTLSRDDEGRSSLTTTEHIVTVFPDFDQNRGLIRDLTRVYDGHETDLQVQSVTDETGAPRDYTTELYGDFLSVIMAVPEGQYVHGAQHYVVTYTQRDVTAFFEDGNVDEFYWDINGTGWTQPFGRVTARITLDESVADAFNDTGACYYGTLYEDNWCELTYDEDGAITAEVHDLVSGENVTIALGFEPGTFAPAPEPPVPFLRRVPLLLWAGFASAAGAVLTFIVAITFGRRRSSGRAIIAQYEPQPEIPVAVAAELLGAGKKSMTATLLDLAVRGHLRLLSKTETNEFGAQAVNGLGLSQIETATFRRIFGRGADGKSVWFVKTSTVLGDAAASMRTQARAAIKTKNLRKHLSPWYFALGATLPILSVLLLIVHFAVTGDFTMMTVVLAVGINALIWGLLISLGILSVLMRPTKEGALVLDHLKGLREYIRLAEVDRIRMLQSVSGAEVDEKFIVKVYERLLPYAVLFGFEREWQQELAKYYTQSAPEWMANTSGNPISSINSLSLSRFGAAVAAAPVTAPKFSSSSGSGHGSGSSFSSSRSGSSGGGFSGGGGGGGGGRGI